MFTWETVTINKHFWLYKHIGLKLILYSLEKLCDLNLNKFESPSQKDVFAKFG